MVLGEGGKPELPEKTGVSRGKLEYHGDKPLGTEKKTNKFGPHMALGLKSNPGHIGER